MKTTMKTLGLATVTAIALTACGGGGGSTDNTSGGGQSQQVQPFPAPSISEADKNAFLNAINQARATGRYCGTYYAPAVSPLEWDDGLYAAAYEHSQDMAATGYYEHEGSGTETDYSAKALGLDGGSDVLDRIGVNTANSTRDFRNYGDAMENIASRNTSLDAVMNGWLASDGHCGAIMRDTSKYVGMAKVGRYWTQDFTGSGN
jgi:uncharacterized protein YkwD